MPQPRPTYPGMTTVQSRELLKHLTKRYGKENVRWPVIFYRVNNLQPLWLTFEVNERNSTNAGITERFFREGELPEYFIDYTASTRQVVPFTAQHWPDPPGDAIIYPNYSSSYDYVMSQENRSLNTIDIDYVWRTNDERYFGLEVTTFWVRMVNVDKAIWLVKQAIKRRMAATHAHQFRLLAQVAQLQRITLSVVFVNVVEKGSNEIYTDGNAFVVPLNVEMADGLHRGEFPAHYDFLPWRTLVASL